MSGLHLFIPKFDIKRRLILSHVEVSKMVLLITTTNVVIKLIDQFGN